MRRHRTTASTDSDLVAAAVSGDDDAFALLVSPLIPALLGRVEGSGLEEDTVQNILMRAHQGLPGFRADARFSTWIYTITTNEIIRSLQAQSKAPRVDSVAVQRQIDQQRQLADLAEQQALADGVRWALEQVPQGARELLIKAYEEQQTLEAIAQDIEIPVGTVKSRLFSSRRAFINAYQGPAADGAAG